MTEINTVISVKDAGRREEAGRCCNCSGYLELLVSILYIYAWRMEALGLKT